MNNLQRYIFLAECASRKAIIDIFERMMALGKIFFVILRNIEKNLIDYDTIDDRIWQGGKGL